MSRRPHDPFSPYDRSEHAPRPAATPDDAPAEAESPAEGRKRPARPRRPRRSRKTETVDLEAALARLDGEQ